MSQPVITELSGVVVTYAPESGDYIPSGKYSLPVTGANDVRVYYKPCLDLTARLSNDYCAADEMAEFCEGEYYLDFDVINPETGEPVSSELVGAPECSVTVNGQPLESFASGDRLTVAQGDLLIEIEAVYLKYNSLVQTMSYTALAQALPLELSVSPSDLRYNVSSLGQEGSTALLTVRRDGAELTQEQWDSMVLPTVVCDANAELSVVKGSQPSTYLIMLEPFEDDAFATDTGNFTLTVTAAGMFDGRLSSGSLEQPLTIADDYTGAQRFGNFIKKYGVRILISILAIVLILGYIPPFKKYLPKKLKTNPTINCRPKRRGSDTTQKGSCERDLISLLVPYMAQTGTIRFAPMSCRPSVPRLVVRAAGGNGMYVVNYKDFIGKDYITFGGTAYDESLRKPPKIYASMDLRTITENFISNCNLNI